MKRIGMAMVLVAGVLLANGGYIQLKAMLAQWLLTDAWTRTLQESPDSGLSVPENKPWPWADTYPIGELSIPALDSHWIVLAGSSGRNLAFAPTHMSASAPVGASGVSVISAHRDTHFSALQALLPGTSVYWQDHHANRLHYRVVSEAIVDVNKDRINLEYEGPDNLLLLTTCYPFGAEPGGPLRKVFYLQPVPEDEAAGGAKPEIASL
ncbi:sortase, marine proteobacterial type [Hahella sp. CCB-MM4]|uniref:class GN sortase n=1 Tax=Hahella sp. (strain CCB-MM4) TaxID=1926491 RepID=UPI000B9BC2A6|nr:class GN sortase [Hahella sp. CCB-MM4]OZG72845.1 sortase, marine proteobacterial type [Hahella sp. CCB-MM4]